MLFEVRDVEWNDRGPPTAGQVFLIVGHVGGENGERCVRWPAARAVDGANRQDAERQKRNSPEDVALEAAMRGVSLVERPDAPATANDMTAAQAYKEIKNQRWRSDTIVSGGELFA